MDILQLRWVDFEHLDEEWFRAECKRIAIQEDIASELCISYTVSARGIVFKEFKDGHILKADFTPDPHLPVIRTYDFGKVCAVTFSQVDNFDRITFFHEILLEEKENATDSLARAALSHSSLIECSHFIDYADPSGAYKDGWSDNENTSFDILKLQGIYPKCDISKADNKRRINGNELLKYKLADWPNNEPVIRFHKSMEGTIESFRTGYTYKVNNQTKKISDIIDEQHPFEDLIDCVRMTVMERFPIKKISRDFPTKTPRKRDKYTNY